MSIRDYAEKLELSLDLSPLSRDRHYKGRVKQSFSAWSSHLSKMVLSNLLAILFLMPLLVVFFMYLPQVEKAAIAGMNFSGGLGIGYGVIDDTLLGISTLYELRQKFVLIALIPALMLGSIGICGLYYCCRNALWGTKLNVFRAFFRGVAKSWYKFLVAFTYLGILATGFVYSLLEILKQNAVVGSANPWLYVAIVFVSLLIVPSLMFMLIYLPMCVSYRYKQKNDSGEPLEVTKVQANIFDYKVDIKNSLLMSVMLGFSPLFILIALAAPVALIFAGFFKYIIYVLILIFGLSLYTILDLAYAQFGNDSFIFVLYEEEERIKHKEAQKAARKAAQKNKQQNQKGGKKNKRR